MHEVDRTEAVAKRLQPWFGEEIEALYSTFPTRRDGLLMGCPVWGKEYIERFALYCLASLGSPANMAALKDRCTMVIYCEQAAKPVLFRLTRWMSRAGIDLVFRTIPDWVLELTKEWESQFLVLGCSQNVLTHMAGRAGMAFHMMMPDHVYAHEYFPNLFRLGKKHEAIYQAGLSVDIDAAADDIEKCRNEQTGALVIPDIALGDMAVRHVHKQSLAHVMNLATIPDKIPKSHRLIWQGKDHIRIHSCHGNPIWLAPHLVRDSPIAFTSTLDCLCPEYIPGAFHVPTPDDGLGFIEVSDYRKPELGHSTNADEFAEWVLNQTSFSDDYAPYFARPTLMPTSHNADGMETAEIDRQYHQVVQIIDERRPAMMQAFLQRRFGSRFQQDASLPESVK